ncbi:MAG: hypothetical protein KKC75_05845 [Nanoarchaeota archaeon]|nr:hypothetical protein [Nanoarchaeota archaeon]MBU1004798.1 hypothetical protein [Nanoarchaeota archaeon]MBU1946484.1 hypothetical protein [Nanoarchaeota archaeon]
MKIKMFLILLLIIPAVFAEVECSKVWVVNFAYDNGLITPKEKELKCGYAPDRTIQPDEGYTAEIVSMDDETLYSFNFQIPLKFNFDLSDPLLKGLSGGMLILNETDFALIFPYYDQAKNIVIYNPRKYKVANVPLVEEQFIQKKSFWWLLFLILALLIIGYIGYRYYKKRKESTAKTL